METQSLRYQWVIAEANNTVILNLHHKSPVLEFVLFMKAIMFNNKHLLKQNNNNIGYL